MFGLDSKFYVSAEPQTGQCNVLMTRLVFKMYLDINVRYQDIAVSFFREV